MNSDKQEVSEYYPEIICDKYDTLVAKNENSLNSFAAAVILSPDGKEISPEFQEYTVLGPKQVMIKPIGEKTFTILTKRKDGVYRPKLTALRNPQYDEQTNIVFAKQGGKMIVFGRNLSKIYEIDAHAGKIIMDKL